MIAKTLAFLAGALALQYLPGLPPAWSVAAAVPAIAGLFWPAARLSALFALGFLWAALQAQQVQQSILDPRLEGRPLLVEGTVADIPRQFSDKDIRFLLHVERASDADTAQAFTGTIRLSWYRTDQRPALGERWQLAVKLKRPHGYANPGGFDYERWLFQQRISATGYVRKDARNRRLAADAAGFMASLRRYIASRFDALDSGSGSLPLIRALTIGERGTLTPAHWDTLRATGTSHLMAISGLHISLVAGLVFGLVRLAWSRMGTLAEILPAPRAAAVAALLAAALYAGLAGLGIPTRRALVMVAVAMLAIWAGKQTRPAQVLCLAALAVVLVDPLALLAAGWWLSFWAVTLILYTTAGRLGGAGVWRKWCQVHMVLAVSLLPVLLVFFQQTSLVSPLANVAAVPWVSLLVVPTALTGTLMLAVSEPAGSALLALAAWFMDLLWPLLARLGDWGPALLHWHQPVWWTLLPATAGILLLFAPRGIPGRGFGLLLMLPMIAVKPPGPGPGEAWVTLLDVGQGLSTVVRTRRHTLVYDAGPRYSPSFDTGTAVVVPYLRSRGIRHIDRLVVSHGDNDHVGGVASLLDELSVARLSAGVPEAIKARTATPCRRGEHWNWDGVGFAVLHPGEGRRRKGNNASCVIRITAAGGQRILLTGDIESSAEQALLGTHAGQLRAEVLVVPHHGSLTSSSGPFIEAVSPDTVLFPVGYRNRYGFPRQKVVDRYRSLGAGLFDTASHGAVSIRLGSGRRPVISAYRCAWPRYWRARPCGDDKLFGCCGK
jgi:competence protein ComEC